jgi:hypothetical protein
LVFGLLSLDESRDQRSIRFFHHIRRRTGFN